MKHTVFTRALALLLVVASLAAVLVVPAAAATTTAFDILSTSKYAKVYTLSTSGRTTPYTSKTLSTRGTVTYGRSSNAYIDNAADELYVFDVGQTNNKYWAYVSYPSGSRRVNAYIPLSAISRNNANHAKTVSTGKFYCSTRENAGNSSSYYVAKGDTVYLLSTGTKYQIMYPTSNGLWRIAFCNASDYNKYCAPASTNSSSSVIGGKSDTPKNGATVRIRYAANGRYLDIPSDQITKDGVQLQIWDSAPSNHNQYFRLVNTGNGWQILSLQSGKVVEVRNSSHDDCAQVAQWAKHNGACARWEIINNSDGTVSFRNKESGKYLNVYGGGNAGNGTKMIQYHNDGTVAMKFYIKTESPQTTSSTNTVITNNTAGMTDVTAYFAGKTITLQSVQNGKYMCANGNLSGTPLVCTSTSAGTRETFTVSNLTSDGWVGLKAANGKYLSAISSAANTPLRANAPSLYGWECFRIYQKGSDFYFKAQVNGKFLCVRVDTTNAPVQAYANEAAGWERFTIRIRGQEQYLSMAELIYTATANGIAANSNAFKALESINTKYAPKLTSTEEQGTVVFMFEGVGNDASANKRMNAMCVLVRNGDVIYLNRNCSTIPDYPFNPAKNQNDPMPTTKSGIHNFTTVNHGGYAALNVTAVPVVRFRSKSNYYSSTSYGINVHRRSTDTIASSSANWVNSAGCLIIGRSGKASTDEYARFVQALGIVSSNASGNTAYRSRVSGKIVIDRAYAASYLSAVGYSTSAINLIG